MDLRRLLRRFLVALTTDWCCAGELFAVVHGSYRKAPAEKARAAAYDVAVLGLTEGLFEVGLLGRTGWVPSARVAVAGVREALRRVRFWDREWFLDFPWDFVPTERGLRRSRWVREKEPGDGGMGGRHGGQDCAEDGDETLRWADAVLRCPFEVIGADDVVDALRDASPRKLRGRRLRRRFLATVERLLLDGFVCGLPPTEFGRLQGFVPYPLLTHEALAYLARVWDLATDWYHDVYSCVWFNLTPKGEEAAGEDSDEDWAAPSASDARPGWDESAAEMLADAGAETGRHCCSPEEVLEKAVGRAFDGVLDLADLVVAARRLAGRGSVREVGLEGLGLGLRRGVLEIGYLPFVPDMVESATYERFRSDWLIRADGGGLRRVAWLVGQRRENGGSIERQRPPPGHPLGRVDELLTAWLEVLKEGPRPAWEGVRLAARLFPQESEERWHELALQAFGRGLLLGLLDTGPEEFQPWPGGVEEALARVEREWEELGRDPTWSEIAWLRVR